MNYIFKLLLWIVPIIGAFVGTIIVDAFIIILNLISLLIIQIFRFNKTKYRDARTIYLDIFNNSLDNPFQVINRAPPIPKNNKGE